MIKNCQFVKICI